MQNAKMPNYARNVWVSGDLHARDIVEYADDLHVLWDVELNQLEAVQTDFRCHFVTDGHAIVYDELYGARAAVCGALRGARICFALSNRIGRSGCWKGRQLPDFALAYTHGEREVDVQWAQGTTNIMVILSREVFARRLEQLSGRPLEKAFPPASMYLRLAPASWAGLKTRVQSLLRGQRPDLHRTLEETLADTIVEACRDRIDVAWEDSPAAWFHFRRAISHIERKESPPRLTELARELGLTLRSVETAFQSCTGMSPATYLRCERLNRVREDLIEHGPSDATVTELAMRRGFTELGRFAVEYRRVFGEKPSQTLQRRSAGSKIVIPALR